jgi:hypothetical protein
MNIAQFRSAVQTALQAWQLANYPTTDIVYENGPCPAQDVISSPWVDVDIRWYSAHQMTLGDPVKGRSRGVVAITIYSRSGSGTFVSDAMLDSLREALTRLPLAGAELSFPQPYTPTDMLGWYKTGLMFPFRLDT